MNKNLNALKKLSFAAIFGMYLVLVMGSLVTNTESGEGCGRSWPLCHGAVAPLPTIDSIIEFSHRAVTGIAGLIVILLAIWAYRVLSHRPETKWLVAIAVGFLLIESGLGAATVLWPEPPEILALHMGVSLISFAGVLLLGVLVIQLLNSSTHRQTRPQGSFVKLVWFTAFWSIIVIYLGAYVRHAAPGISCHGWPLCNGMLLPELYGSVGIQFVHRLAAAVFMLLIVVLYLKSRSYRLHRPDLYQGALCALIFAVLQNLSGAYLVFDGARVGSIMIHSAILPFVFGSLSYLCMQVSAEPRQGDAEAHESSIRSSTA